MERSVIDLSKYRYGAPTMQYFMEYGQ